MTPPHRPVANAARAVLLIRLRGPARVEAILRCPGTPGDSALVVSATDSICSPHRSGPSRHGRNAPASCGLSNDQQSSKQ